MNTYGHFSLSVLIPRCLQRKFAYSRLDTPQLAAARLHFRVCPARGL